MTTYGKFCILLCTLAYATNSANAQRAIAISSDPGPGLLIALNWSPEKNAVKYNIYRRNEADTKYPTVPLNTVPLQPLTSCTAIKSLLIRGTDSSDWKAVEKGLAKIEVSKVKGELKKKVILFDPCKLATALTDKESYNKLQGMARGSWYIAMAAGWGYMDKMVTNGKVYYYKIVAMNTTGAVIETVATELKVTAGLFIKPGTPTGLSAEPGDDAVLLTWNATDWAAGYIVERAKSPLFSFRQINESRYMLSIRKRLNGDTIVPALPGMMDYQRYKVSGKDSSHVVNGFPIDGPKNSITYIYRVKAVDLFNRSGDFSATANATPIDSTPPSAPLDITASAESQKDSVIVGWAQVVKNTSGNWERPDSSVIYRLYRFASSDNPDSIPSVFVAETKTIRGQLTRDTIDADHILRSEYGNKTWWYRLRALDKAGNISQWSSAVSVIVKDNKAPAITKNVSTKGLEKSIVVKWNPNTEPDIASYMIYRSLCHLGSWVECQPDDTCKTWQSYNPYNEMKANPDEMPSITHVEKKPGLPCPCSGPFVFLGEITKDSVKRAIESGNYFFEDRNVDPSSPLCYAYWIKAKDSSDNLSGSFPIPGTAERKQIKCERLRDLTPPEKAIISGLYAQADMIKVEWIGPPTQDTRAYHVYRAQGTKPSLEPTSDKYEWVGGMTVELPPVVPVTLTKKYEPPAMTTCDRISVQATPWMSAGFFEDKKIEPKLTYWYKVVGIDYDGNECSLDSAAAISTFTFSNRVPAAPVITAITKLGDPCIVKLTWSPVFNASLHKGFIVYRSISNAGPFIPVVTSPLTSNSFSDNNVVKGMTYWYKVGVLMANGQLSPLSPFKSIAP
jgi:fibronectin type 3 domain-containing protein